VLIDAGISSKLVQQYLASLNVDIADIDAILITHEHADHIKGLSTFASKWGIPVFANSETAKGICSLLDQKPRFKIFSTGESFEFGDLEIHPFTVQHDTLDPVAFTIRVGGLKLGFCTDLGFVTSLVIKELQECDYLYVEANHQPSMVQACSRPLIYKQRVLGRQGHLSNEECAKLLTEVHHSGLKHVHLAHLSSECNSKELALEIVEKALKEKGKSVDLSIAYQEQISRPIFF